MSNENKHNKPDCPLIGQNSNIFNIVRIAAKTLKRTGQPDGAPEMRK